MSQIENKLAELGLVLPPPIAPPPGIVLPFKFVRVLGTRAYVAGHGPQNPDGSLAEPRGKVGREVTPERAHELARLTALAMNGTAELARLQARAVAGAAR